MEKHVKLNRASIDKRSMDELIGLSRGILADGNINQKEAEFLQKWLISNYHITENPIIGTLLQRVEEMLDDEVLDDDEASELFDTLQRFTGNDFEIGEILKSTTLPLCHPPPDLQFKGKHYSFTGTFSSASRKECENSVKQLGATTGGLSSKTNYLVIGDYATQSWKHSAFGNKIEKAAELRDKGHNINIISEAHWLKQIKTCD